MLALLVAVLAVNLPSQALPLPAAEAGRFVGRTGSFEGPVAAIRVGPRGALLLELDAKAPHASLTVLVPASVAAGMPAVKSWSGKRVVVRGLVRRVEGQPQITVEKATDLTVAEQPDRIPCEAAAESGTGSASPSPMFQGAFMTTPGH